MHLDLEKLVQLTAKEQARFLATIYEECGTHRESQELTLLRDLIRLGRQEEAARPDLDAGSLSAVDLTVKPQKRSALKGHLQEFFDSHPVGRMLPLALSIVDVPGSPAKCSLRVAANKHCPQECRLWRPHLQLGTRRFSEAYVIYTEPIVFWDTEFRCYVRLLDLNVDVGDHRMVEAEIRRYLRQQEARRAADPAHPNPYAERLRMGKLLPTYQYESSGEVQGGRRIGACLAGLSRELDGTADFVRMETSRNVGEQKIYDQSTILIGNMRTNHLIATLQPGGTAVDLSIAPYRILEDCIEHRFDGRLCRDGKQPEGRYRGEYRAYCLITRWQTRAHTTTTIAANNGKVVTAAADLLTNPVQIASILSHAALTGHLLVPRLFQILVSSSFEDRLESQFGIAEIEDVWVSTAGVS